VFTARYGLSLYMYFRLFLAFKGLRYSQGEFANYEPVGYYMYHQFKSTILRSSHTAYLCVLCGSENKQRLFPYTALTYWFL